MEWTQAVLGQARAIMASSYDLDNEIMCLDPEIDNEAWSEAIALKSRAAAQVEGYVRDHLAAPLTAHRLLQLSLQALEARTPVSRPALLTTARDLVWQVAELPVWQAGETGIASVRESAEHE